MIIAVNTRLRKEEQPEGYEDFMFGILNTLTEKYPEHQFLYIFDKAYDEKFRFAQNILPIIAGPETRTSLRLQYWFNYKIPAVLRKHRADVFVSMEGICSLRTKKPQCLLISDLSFLQESKLIKKTQNRFHAKYTPLFLAKAKSIATVSEFFQSVLADHYKIKANDTQVIHPCADDIFKPLVWEEKERIKEKYADGKAFFLFSGDIDRRSNLITLLKAFSFFKKRQKSNMLLLVAGTADERFKKELKTYKFREEVKLLEELTKKKLAEITAAAYAMVYPVLHTDLALPALQAMQCEVPVIVADSGALPSICGKAALYVKPDDFKDIAEKMMLIFKNEDKAAELVQAGKIIAQQRNWNKSATLLMESIQKAIDN